MKDISFAFSDSKVLALESRLLTAAQLDTLVAAKDTAAVRDLLLSWGFAAGSEDASDMLKAQEKDAFDTVSEFFDGTSVKALLTCENDFHNLKSALKSLILSGQPVGYIEPTALDTQNLLSVWGEKRYEELPEFFAKAAKDAYAVATKVGDGQQIDLCLDKYCLQYMLLLANQSQNGFIKDYFDLFVELTDIKVVFRAVKTGKSADFMQSALVSTDNLDALSLAKAAAKGEDSLFTFLQTAGYKEFAEALKNSPAAFEKMCDDALMARLKESRLISFGPEKVLAYYYARLVEIRNLRIILTCKESGASYETVAERMREIYV